MSTEPEPTESEQNSSPYIRTFAKDFAALAAKNPELAGSTPPKPKPRHKSKTPPPPKKIIPKPSTLDAEAQNIDERTRDELLSVPTSETSQKIEPLELPKINPGDITPSGPSDEERSEILKRLKDKAAAAAQLEPTFIASPITPPVRITPEVVKIEKPPEPIPVPKPPIVLHDEAAPSPIHTYKTDFTDHVEEKNASSFSIIAAEKDAGKREAPEPTRRGTGKLLPIVLGIVLLLVAGVGVYAAYIYMSKNAPVLLSPTQSSLITPDARVQLTGSGFTLMEALADKADEPLANDSVLLTYIDAATTTPQGVSEAPTSGGAFITQLNLAAPDILLRNIDPSSMVGIVHAGSQTSPFFILRVTSYERTFAGMLQWEPTMLQSLNPLYPLYPANAPEATTAQNASSTVPAKIFIPAVDPTTPSAQFVDEIVASHSARALKDNAGRTLVLYGYADKQTLIIARDEAAFSLLLTRLAATGN